MVLGKYRKRVSKSSLLNNNNKHSAEGGENKENESPVHEVTESTNSTATLGVKPPSITTTSGNNTTFSDSDEASIVIIDDSNSSDQVGGEDLDDDEDEDFEQNEDLEMMMNGRRPKPGRKSTSSGEQDKRASIYSMASISEHDRAQLLRDEITRESLSLQRLERLVEDLPRLKATNGLYQYQYSNQQGDYEDGQSTSKVIERLQTGLDHMRRELKEQTEIAKEERAGKDALKKRTEILESTMEVLKHQNAMLNRLIERKERKAGELETGIKERDERINTFEQAQRSNLTIHDQYKQQIDQANAERDQAHAQYEAVLDSCRKMKAKYHDDIVVIGDKIGKIQQDREADHQKLQKLTSQLESQGKEKEHLNKLQSQTSELRKRHLKSLEFMFEDMKQVIVDSDKGVGTTVKNTLRVINQLEQQYIDLGGDGRKLEFEHNNNSTKH